MTPTPTTPAAETATKSRRVYSAQEKAEYLALFDQGGLSPADFCREFSLSEATFSLWRRQAREACLPGQVAGQAERVQFAEVQVAAPVKTCGVAFVTLHLPGGAKLEVNDAGDSMWQGLGLLLKTLNP